MISGYMGAKSLLGIQTPVFEPLEERLLLSGDALMDLNEYMVYPQVHRIFGENHRAMPG